MDQRIKGQENSLFITQDGATLAQFDSIQDAELTLKLTLLQEGYQGETTDRYDEVFHGIGFTFSAHLTTGAVFDAFQAIIDRARRRTPGTVFNLKSVLQFPNGERRRVIIDNLFFSDIPITLPRRDQYVAVKVSGGSASGRFIT